MNATRALREEFGSDYAFVLVYVVDPHPLAPDPSPYRGEPWEFQYSKFRQARSHEERADDANQVSVKDVFDEVLVDDLEPDNPAGNNPVWCTWGPAPNPGWLLSAKSGRVLLGQPWLNTTEMRSIMGAAQRFTR